MALCHVEAKSQDTNENVMGRSHANPMLDTRTYHVQCAGGKVTQLTTVIEESMYAQCKSDGNEYLLQYVLANYQNDNKAISLSDQQITVQGRPVTPKATAG